MDFGFQLGFVDIDVVGCFGIVYYFCSKPYALLSVHVFSKEDSLNMAVSTKNIMAYPKMCAETNCDKCDTEDCRLCHTCMEPETKVQLINAYREHIDRHDCKRVFPPKFVSAFSFLSWNCSIFFIFFFLLKIMHVF